MIAVVCVESPRPGRAVKAAEQLARGLADTVQTIAVVAGGPRDSESLTWAVARRTFQRVVHVDDGALGRPDHVTLGTVLAEVVRHLGAGLVIAGERSDDEGQGLVPAALAQHWHAPLIARVARARRAGRSAEAGEARDLELVVRAGGKLCTLAVPCPVVLSTSEASEISKISIDSSMPDARTPAIAVETMTLAQLSVDASRMVPRPELLGSLAPLPSRGRKTNEGSPMSPDEAARFLLRQP